MDRVAAVANGGRGRRRSEATAPQLLVARQLINMADSLTSEMEAEKAKAGAQAKQSTDLVNAVVPVLRTIRDTLVSASDVMARYGEGAMRSERCRRVLLEFFNYSAVVEPLLLSCGVVVCMCQASDRVHRRNMRWVQFDIDTYDLHISNMAMSYKRLVSTVESASQMLKAVMEAASEGQGQGAVLSPPRSDALLNELDRLSGVLEEAQGDIHELERTLDVGKQMLDTLQVQLSDTSRKWGLGSVALTGGAIATMATLAHYDVISQRTVAVFAGLSLLPLGRSLLLFHDDLTDVKLELKRRLLIVAQWREKFSRLELKVRKLKTELASTHLTISTSRSEPQHLDTLRSTPTRLNTTEAAFFP